MKTTALRTQDIEQKWYILDCTGKKLGRLSVQVANILRGKNKPEYTPNSDVGDFVILLNAKNIYKSQRKIKQRKIRNDYYRFCLYVSLESLINFKVSSLFFQLPTFTHLSMLRTKHS